MIDTRRSSLDAIYRADKAMADGAQSSLEDLRKRQRLLLLKQELSLLGAVLLGATIYKPRRSGAGLITAWRRYANSEPGRRRLGSSGANVLWLQPRAQDRCLGNGWLLMQCWIGQCRLCRLANTQRNGVFDQCGISFLRGRGLLRVSKPFLLPNPPSLTLKERIMRRWPVLTLRELVWDAAPGGPASCPAALAQASQELPPYLDKS
jgi:hypothetical protein